MPERFDLVVIGAGPAGAAAALTAARHGAEVLLLDKAPLGRPKTCAGGISPRAREALRDLGLWDAVAAEARPVHGLRLVSASGREVTLAGAEAASVLNRTRLDALLVGAAARAGVRTALGTAADALLREDGRVTGVVAGGQEIRARWVVAADGAPARFGPRAPATRLQAVMGWWEGVPFRPGIVEMFFDPELMPHYGWLFPESPTRVNVGLCLREDRLPPGSLRRLFDRILRRHLGDRLSGATPLGPLRGHPLRATTRVGHDAQPGLLVAGEANGLVNVATGEGISYALESGVLAGTAIARADRDGWAPERAAAWYRHRLRTRFAVPFGLADWFQRHGVRALDGVTALGALGTVRTLARETLARV